ncbi:helix-turn-helix domain-containing protein [Ruthenibacterium lactatiformans]|uniref:helix-turn-helix domain-containing protein n=1 Tax=Ruthenibacterium lactatiformans TaxID=1550024 RepID=UPI003A8FE3BF
MTFGERLRQLRTEKGLTQKQLAVETGTSERGIQNYEMGIRNPAFDALLSLADYFDVSLDYLCGRSDVRERR